MSAGSEGCTVVSLTLNEVVGSYFAAGMRIVASDAQALNHASTYRRGIRTRFDEEAVGVMGERALAKWLGTYSVDPINTFHAVPDCGDRYEVRSTATRHGRLIVRDNDADDGIFVLALVALDGRVVLRGWCYGWEAKRDEWQDDPGNLRPAWWVPQESLNPMNRIPGRTE